MEFESGQGKGGEMCYLLWCVIVCIVTDSKYVVISLDLEYSRMQYIYYHSLKNIAVILMMGL